MTTKADIIDLNEQVRQAIVDAEAYLARHQELMQALKSEDIEKAKQLIKGNN